MIPTSHPMSRRPKLRFRWTAALPLALSVVLAACGPGGAPSNAPAVEASQQRPIKAAMVALEAILHAHAEGPLTRATVRDAIAQTNQAESLLGIPIAFDAKGDVQNATFFLYQVQGGAFVPAR